MERNGTGIASSRHELGYSLARYVIGQWNKLTLTLTLPVHNKYPNAGIVTRHAMQLPAAGHVLPLLVTSNQAWITAAVYGCGWGWG